MLHTSSPFTTQSLELGPRLNLVAPSFTVRDHTEQPQHLNDLMGEKGLVLGFIGDIWHEASVRRMLWLQRHAHQLLRTGCNMALLICDQPHMLYGFYVSSATPPAFPLLADVDGGVHRLFNMARYPGMVVIDPQGIIRHKWLMPDDRVWPRVQEMLDVMQSL